MSTTLWKRNVSDCTVQVLIMQKYWDIIPKRTMNGQSTVPSLWIRTSSPPRSLTFPVGFFHYLRTSACRCPRGYIVVQRCLVMQQLGTWEKPQGFTLHETRQEWLVSSESSQCSESQYPSDRCPQVASSFHNFQLSTQVSFHEYGDWHDKAHNCLPESE